MTKEINEDWMKELNSYNTNNQRKEVEREKMDIDWVQNNKGFKRKIAFKVLPANEKENKVFAHVIGMHWLDNFGSKGGFVCPEKTLHLKKQKVVCPICEAAREARRRGLSKDDLCISGKFGPINIFEPKITSNVKVVVLKTDTKEDWNRKHISVFQQKGTILAEWLANKYRDSDIPDFLQWEKSNVLQFKRESDNGSFEREVTFSTYSFSPEVLEKLKEENESFTLPDLWPMPNDEEIIRVKDLVDTKIKNIFDTKNEVHAALDLNTNEETTSEFDEDDIPF